MSNRYSLQMYQERLKTENQVKESRNLLVLSLLKEGVDEHIISRSIGISLEDILEIKGVMEVGYGDYIHDLEHARKRQMALNMLGDGVDEMIVVTVSGLKKEEIVELVTLCNELTERAKKRENMIKQGLSSVH